MIRPENESELDAVRRVNTLAFGQEDEGLIPPPRKPTTEAVSFRGARTRSITQALPPINRPRDTIGNRTKPRSSCNPVLSLTGATTYNSVIP